MSVQAVGLQRNTLDQYYTNPELATKCIGLFIEVVKPSSSDLVIEPSAGAGSFSDILRDKLTCNVICFDIEPKKEYISKEDFLTLDTHSFHGCTSHCIGNPPFGRQSSLAKKFIKKCCEFSNSVAFILPRSFKKPSLHKTFPLCFHKVYEEDCPTNSFLVNGTEYDVPCVYQIWIKKDTHRVEEDSETPQEFEYVPKSGTPHIALRRVGFYAGKAFIEHESKSCQSHYFIKIHEHLVGNNTYILTTLVEKLNAFHFEFNNTVGARSISKSEFTKVINAQIRVLMS
jgi:predicted RNA methylase